MIFLTGGESMERMFGLDWQLLSDSCLMIIAVFVLFVAMSYLLFNPARKLLQDRQQKIRGELDDARNNMEQAQAMRQEYEEKLKTIDKDAERILSEARKKALENENQIIAGARDEANRILDRARAEAQLEKQKVADEVKREMISLASVMAGKVVSASIDTSVRNGLIEETLKEMGESTWLS